MFEKKSLKWVPQPKDWGPEKGAFLGASKGRTNWQGTAFSPCEAELKCTVLAPPGGGPKVPYFCMLPRPPKGDRGCHHYVGYSVGCPQRLGFHF